MPALRPSPDRWNRFLAMTTVIAVTRAAPRRQRVLWFPAPSVAVNKCSPTSRLGNVPFHNRRSETEDTNEPVSSSKTCVAKSQNRAALDRDSQQASTLKSALEGSVSPDSRRVEATAAIHHLPSQIGDFDQSNGLVLHHGRSVCLCQG